MKPKIGDMILCKYTNGKEPITMYGMVIVSIRGINTIYELNVKTLK